MRLKLVLKIVEGTVLPCNYMYELSSCLYKVLNVIVKTCSDSFLSNSKLTVRPSLDYYTSFFGEV